MKSRYIRSSRRHRDKTISQLLNDSSVEWKKMMQRVKSHPQEANKNLLHKLCLRQDVPPEILDWAIERLGKIQLGRRSGILSQLDPMTPLELCLTQNVPLETFIKVVRASMEMRNEQDDDDHSIASFRLWIVDFAELSLEKLQCLLEECPLQYFDEPMFDYLFEPVLSGELEFDDIKRVKLVLGEMRHVWDIFSTTIFSKQEPVASKDEDNYLLPHTYLIAMFMQLCPYYDQIKPSAIRHILTYFYSSDSIISQQFTQVDSNGNSLLHHICYNAPQRIRVKRPKNSEEQEDDDSSDIESDDSYAGCIERTEEQRLAPWIELLEFILTVHPGCAALRNIEGRTPLHICLERGLPGANLLLESAPITVEIVDPITNLLPFQLAATSYRTKGETENYNRSRFASNPDHGFYECDYDDDEFYCLCAGCRSHSRRKIYIADGPIPGSTVMMHFDQKQDNHDSRRRKCVGQDLHLFSTIYELLRSAPYALNNMERDTSILDSALLKQITFKKWSIAKLSRQNYFKTQILQREIKKLQEQFEADKASLCT